MKLALLVVLAGVVLVPSLTEARIVSKCELKEKLGAAITLPKSLQKYKDKVLALVICGVNMNSHLNTGLVRVYGRTTTPVPMTVVTTLSTPPVNGMTTNGSATNGSATNGSATNGSATNGTSTNGTSTNATSANGTTTSTVATTSVAMTPSPNATASNQTALRRKREAPKSSKESDAANVKVLKALLNKEVTMYDEVKGRDEGPQNRKAPWSLGYYGLFQLSDSHFCNSGYRWSRNKCGTACTAFTDDNIMDDIDCFVKTGYWLAVLRDAPPACYHVQNFFAECQ